MFRKYGIRPPEWFMDDLPSGEVTNAWLQEVVDQFRMVEDEIKTLRDQRTRMMITEGVANECYEILKTYFNGKQLTTL